MSGEGGLSCRSGRRLSRSCARASSGVSTSRVSATPVRWPTRRRPGSLACCRCYAETKETVAWLSSMTISGDVGDPVDVVPVLRFLVAPEARWVTAQTIYVNGGMISPIN